MPNVAKLSMSLIVRLTRDLGLRISGPAGMLHAYDSDDKAALKHATRRPLRRWHQRDGAVRPGAPDLRRDRPGAAQHHRRTGARACPRSPTTTGSRRSPSCPRTPSRRRGTGRVGTGGSSGWSGRTGRCGAPQRSWASPTTCPPPGSSTAPGVTLEVAMVLDALEDAGLTLADVDGVCHAESAVAFAEYLGIHPVFMDSTMTGGSSYEVHIEHAAAAIAAGVCDVVVSVYASTPRSDRTRRRGRPPRATPAPTPRSSGTCPTACAPDGPLRAGGGPPHARVRHHLRATGPDRRAAPGNGPR